GLDWREHSPIISPLPRPGCAVRYGLGGLLGYRLIWRRIVASVILSSSARRNALLRITLKRSSSANGRNSLLVPRPPRPRAGTMHRNWSFGFIITFPLPRWMR